MNNYICKLNKCPAFNSDNSTSTTKGYCYWNGAKIHVDSGVICLPDYYTNLMEFIVDYRIDVFGKFKYDNTIQKENGI